VLTKITITHKKTVMKCEVKSNFIIKMATSLFGKLETPRRPPN